MSAEYQERSGTLIVMPAERLDTGTSPSIEQEVMSRVDAGTSKVVFDFGRTSYVSSAGLRVILKVAKAVDKRKGGVAICSANSHIKSVLELSGFQTVFKLEKTADKAIAAL